MRRLDVRFPAGEFPAGIEHCGARQDRACQEAADPISVLDGGPSLAGSDQAQLARALMAAVRSSFFRQRARVGPMLPIGMPSRVLICW